MLAFFLENQSVNFNQKYGSVLGIPNSPINFSIPNISSAIGWGISLTACNLSKGLRNASLEISYQEEEHSDKYLNLSGTSFNQMIQLNFEYIFYRWRVLSPYFLIGMAYNNNLVRGASEQGTQNVNEVFQGMGGELGAGFKKHLFNRFDLNLEIMYEIINAFQVSTAPTGSVGISPTLLEAGLEIKAGILVGI